VLGTAVYLSPEQALGERATPASDRYSLAVVAFELLTGQRPFESDSITAEATAHVSAPVPSISSVSRSLPDELDPVFQQAMAKDPAQRFDSAAEFVAAIRAALADAAGTTRTLRPVVAAAAATTLPGARVPRRPAPPSRWAALGGLLALGAIGGAIAAIVLTNGNSKPAAKASAAKTVTTVVTQGTTVQTSVPAAPTAPSQTSLSGPALNNAGFLKEKAGDYSGALPLLQQAVTKLSGAGFPYEAYANYNLGYTLLQLGQCNEAMPYLETAKQLEPKRHEPHDALKAAKHCGRD
jgi:serine/threonine-protein kinase